MSLKGSGGSAASSVSVTCACRGSRGVDDWEAKKPKNGELGEPGVGRRGLRDLLVLAVVGPGPPRGQLRTRGPGRKWQPTPMFLPGKSQGRVGCRLWGRTESDTTEATYGSKILGVAERMFSNTALLPFHFPAKHRQLHTTK